MRLEARLERRDARGRERPGDEAPQPGVVRRVDGEHVPGERRAGQPLVDDVGVGVHRGEHVLGEAGVAERLAGGAVADDEPGVVTVAEADGVHRAPLAHRGEERVRVVLDVVGPGAPGDQRLRHRRCSGVKPEQSRAMVWIRPVGPRSA